MIIGIICIVIGVIWFISSFMVDPSSAPQQTVQYLGFVCGSIFVIGGVILLKLNKIVTNTEEQNNLIQKIINTGNISENIGNGNILSGE